MCDTFECNSCNKNFINRCKDIAFDSTSSCEHTTPIEETTCCETCTTINGVINKLHALTFRAPFLKTVGLSGLECLPEWQRTEVEDALKSKSAWDNKAESREDRWNHARKVKAMGLGCMTDNRLEHQGFTMALTPEDGTVCINTTGKIRY